MVIMMQDYQEMIRRGDTGVVAPCSVWMKLGKPTYLSPGSEFNFKITRPDDLELFKALVQAEMYQQSFGGFQPRLTRKPY